MYSKDRMKIYFEPYVNKYLVCYANEGVVRFLNEFSFEALLLLFSKDTIEEAANALCTSNSWLDPNDSLAELQNMVDQLLELKAIKKTEKSNETSLPKQGVKSRTLTTFSKPLRVQLELTSRCNLHCKHCYNRAKDTEFTKKEWMGIIERLDNWGVPKIQIAGGEPTIYPHFKEIVKELYKRNISLMLYTNATLIDSDLAKFISKHFVSVQVSIDGVEAYHDYFRGEKGAYKKAFRGIEFLLEEKAPVMVAMSVSLENVDMIQSVYDKCEEYGITKFRLAPFALEGRGIDYSYKVNDYISIWKRIVKFMASNSNNKAEILSPLENPLPGKISRIDQLCSAARSFMYISAEGKVFPCPLLSSPEMCAGDVRKDNLSDIWENAKIFKTFREIDINNIPGCKDCNNKCLYWCRGVVYSLTGDLNSSAPYCLRKWGNL
jgi:radical SAM protein with 4Fe4S-binding SPASM domain